jgi:hypothetical protein
LMIKYNSSSNKTVLLGLVIWTLNWHVCSR